MLWFWYSVAAMAVFALLELLMRILAVKASEPRIFSLVFNIYSSLFALLYFLLEGGNVRPLASVSVGNFALIILAILCYGLYERWQFIARKRIEASSYAILTRLTPVVAFLGSIFFLRESITAAKVAGVLLITTASLLLVYKNTKLRFDRGLMFGLVCIALIGSAAFIDKPASAHLPASLYSFIVWFFPTFIVALPRVDIRQFIREFHSGGWKVMVAAFLNVVGYIIFVQTLKLADASRVIPIVSANGIVVVLGGILFLREREYLVRKLLAIAIAFIGILFLQ